MKDEDTPVSYTHLVYDMCKAIDKGMEIVGISLEKKSGGKSGTYLRCGEKGTDGQEESGA